MSAAPDGKTSNDDGPLTPSEMVELVEFSTQVYHAMTEEIEMIILAGLKALRDRAIADDQQSAKSLFVMAFEATDFLRQVALKSPKLVEPAASKVALFPVLIAPNNSRDETNKKLLTECGAGKLSSINTTGQRAMKFSSQASGTAMNIYCRMLAIRKRTLLHPGNPEINVKCQALPDPSRSKAVFKQWKAVAAMFLPGVDGIDCYPKELWKEVFSQDQTDGWKVDEIKKRILQALYHCMPR